MSEPVVDTFDDAPAPAPEKTPLEAALSTEEWPAATPEENQAATIAKNDAAELAEKPFAELTDIELAAVKEFRAEQAHQQGADNGDHHDHRREFRFIRACDLETTKPEHIDPDKKIEKDTSCSFFGDSGAGKTFAAIDLNCKVAALGKTCFYIVAEGQRGFKRRLLAWCTEYGVKLEDLPLYVSMVSAPLNDEDCVGQVIEAVRELVQVNGDPALVTIDSLARNLDGDENSPVDMGAFIRGIDRIRAIPLRHPDHSPQRAHGKRTLPRAQLVEGRPRYRVPHGQRRSRRHPHDLHEEQGRHTSGAVRLRAEASSHRTRGRRRPRYLLRGPGACRLRAPACPRQGRAGQMADERPGGAPDPSGTLPLQAGGRWPRS